MSKLGRRVNWLLNRVLIGVYPGSSVQFYRAVSEDELGLISLAFIFWFGSCRGEFDSAFSVIGPNDEVVFERDLGKRNVESGQTLSFAAGIRNAQFTSTGKYRIVLLLDDKKFEFPLTIGTKPAPLKAPS